MYIIDILHNKRCTLIYKPGIQTVLNMYFFRSIIEPIRNTGFRQTDHFHLSRATGIDFKNQIISTESGLKPGLTYDLSYDKLVIGVGSLSNTFGVPGVTENACFLKVHVVYNLLCFGHLK